jgi:hypothetical protein
MPINRRTLTPQTPEGPPPPGLNEPGGRRGRAVPHPTPPPPVYIPPELDTPHPVVTERATESHGTREVLLDGVDGVRAWGYGRQRIAGKIQYTFKQGTNDVWMVIELGKGEADSLVKCTINGADAATLPGITFWWYPGTPTGTVDSHLAAVDVTWNEAFPGTIHAVVHLTGLDTYWPQKPNPLWEMLMYKPIDPRTDARAYSENLIVHWYDWLIDPEGKNLPAARINKQSFKDAADIADQMVGSRKRFAGHPLFLDPLNPDDINRVFRLLTDSYLFFENGKWKVVIDRPGTAVASYGDSALSRSFKPQGFREDDLERPTKVIVEITDTTNDWKPKQVFAIPAGTPAGTEDDSPITYKAPWIHDEGMGKSRAVYLANSYAYDMKLRVRWNDTASARSLGDLVTQAVNARGLSFTGRLLTKTKNIRKTLYDIVLLEYNAARFSDDVSTSPAMTPSTLPQPSDVPPDVTLSTVTIGEEPYSYQSGFVKTRARIQITNPNFYFLDAVELWFSINGGEYRYYTDFPGGSGAVVFLQFDSINEVNVPYSFKFISRSRYGPKSAGAIKTPASTFVGKTSGPIGPTSLRATVNGSDVLLAWQPSGDLDVTAYELRIGTSADSWSTAALLTQTAMLTWRDTPSYTAALRYFLKAIDSSGHYSAVTATADVTLQSFGASAVETLIWPDFYFAAPSSGLTNWWCGVVYGSGNLIIEQSAFVGGTRASDYRAFLCRTFTPATAESERSSGSYSSVGAWATAVDDPRRGGAPLWAPLPANASGEAWGSLALLPFVPAWLNRRLADLRLRFLSVQHQGTDVPGNISHAQPLFAFALADGSTPTALYRGNQFLRPATEKWWIQVGVSLSSNSAYYQTVVSSDANHRFFGMSSDLRHFPFAKGGAVTNGSGLATISYASYVATQLALTAGVGASPAGSAWLTVNALISSTSGVAIAIDSFDTVNSTVTLRTFNAATGAAVASIPFSYELIDNGGRASPGFTFGSP